MRWAEKLHLSRLPGKVHPECRATSTPFAEAQHLSAAKVLQSQANIRVDSPAPNKRIDIPRDDRLKGEDYVSQTRVIRTCGICKSVSNVPPSVRRYSLLPSTYFLRKRKDRCSHEHSRKGNEAKVDTAATMGLVGFVQYVRLLFA